MSLGEGEERKGGVSTAMSVNYVFNVLIMSAKAWRINRLELLTAY